MILPFTTTINGKPSYFIERIWEGLLRHHFQDDKEFVQYMNDHEARFGTHWDWFPDEAPRLENPKIHTIREDVKDRWKPGNKIDFFINCRQKNMFRFAPVLPVVNVQKFEVEKLCDTGEWYKDYVVLVDDVYQLAPEIKQIALNDGFDTVEEFFKYFNQNYIGKIIHWTNKKY